MPNELATPDWLVGDAAQSFRAEADRQRSLVGNTIYVRLPSRFCHPVSAPLTPLNLSAKQVAAGLIGALVVSPRKLSRRRFFTFGLGENID